MRARRGTVFLCAVLAAGGGNAAEDSLEAAKAAFEQSASASTVETLVREFARFGRWEDGIRYFAATSADQAWSTYGQGVLLVHQQNWAEAARALEAALEDFRRSENRRGKASALHYLGTLYHHQSDYSKALRYYEEALSLQESLGNTTAVAALLNNIGAVHYYRGDFSKALEAHADNLARARQEENPRIEASALNNLGLAHYSLGNFPEAAQCYERSLRIKRRLNETGAVAITLHNLGGVYHRMGDFSRALACFEEALRVYERTAQRQQVARALHNMAFTHAALGNTSMARDLYERSLQMKRAVGDKFGAASSLNSLGNMLETEGRYAEAMIYLRESLALKREIGDRHGAASALHSIGNVTARTGDWNKAWEIYEETLRERREMGDRLGETQVLISLAVTALQRREIPKSLALADAALAAADTVGAPEILYQAHTAAAEIHADIAESNAAMRHFRSAIAIAESMRSLLSESEQKSGFLGTKLEAYEGLVKLLIGFGERGAEVRETQNPSTDHSQPLLSNRSVNAEAFSVAERMKARSFLDELGAAKFSRAGVSEELLQEKQRLEARIKWLRERL